MLPKKKRRRRRSANWKTEEWKSLKLKRQKKKILIKTI